MIQLEFTGNFLMPFYDEVTKRKQWYECEIFRGEKMEFSDVLSGNERFAKFRCLDGETTLVPCNCFKVLRCWNRQ